MVDILDIGLEDTDKQRSGTGTALTSQEYMSSYVDFGSQYYGLRSMGDWTGIELDVPDVTEPSGTTDDSRGETDNSQSVLDLLNSTGQDWSSDKTSSGSAPSFGIDAVQNQRYSTYADSLNAAGLNDLSHGFGIDVLGPVLSGNFSDVSFSNAFTGTTDAVANAVTGGVENAATTVKNLDVNTIAKKGFELVFSKGMPLVGSVLFGQPVTNAFGHQSMRPNGILGIVTDALHYTQYNDIAAIKAMNMANSGLENFSGFYGDYDSGFALDFGMGGITRAPGSSAYTGNMRGLSYEQVKNFEAISKGYVPTTFKFNDGKGNSVGDKIADVGGLQVDPSRPGKGFITADGNFVNGFGTQSYYASMDQVNAMSKNYGLTSDQIKSALAQARSTNKNFKDVVDGMVETNLSVITKAQTAGTYTDGTAGFVGTPKGGAPGSGIEQTGITGWAGSSSIAGQGVGTAVTSSGAAFGPGTPGYSADYVDDYESVDTSPSSVPSAPTDDMTDAYDPGFGDNDNNNDGMGGPGGEGNVGDSIGGGGWGGYEGDARGGLITHGRPQNRNAYAFGTPPAGVQASQSGFIDAPPSQVADGAKVADDRPMKAKEGTYILNAAAVEFAGEQDIRKMIMDAQKEAVRRGLSTDDFERHSNLVDIAVSSGEVTIAPHLVKIIGEDRLEKINKRGIRKTEQRIAQNGQQPVQAARGGFLA